MKTFFLPDLGEGLADAEIYEWYVQEGDAITTDQPMVAMETAKAIVDIPAPFSGQVIKRHGQAGDIIKTHSPLVEFACDKAATVVGSLATEAIVLAEPAVARPSASQPKAISKALPAVRILAKQLQVDLTQLVGSGKDGMITAEDVKLAAKSSTNHENLTGMRRTMAHTMAKSHGQVVAVTVFEDADIHTWSTSTDITVRIVRAIQHACTAEPSLNAWFNGETLQRQLLPVVNLGLAVDTAEGLVLPVIKDVAKFTTQQLRAEIGQLKQRVVNRSLKPSELQDASFVLSNFGMFAGRYATPIVVPPTVAILATGKLRDEVVAWQGQAVVHKILPLSLSFDHRAITGGEATRFMAALLEDLTTAD